MRPVPPGLRVAALQPSVSVTLDRLGCLDSLVACTRYCLQAVPALRERPIQIISDSWTANTDEILSAFPTLVVASVPYRLESLAEILKCGISVLTLAPHSLEDIYKDILLLGNILQVRERSEALVAEMAAEIESTREITGLSNIPLVHCEEWGKPIIHSQPWIAEMVAAAGGRFLGMPGAVTDAASVATQDPEVIIFSWCGAGNRVPLARVVEDRQWQSLRAVRNGQVYCIPDDFLNTPAPNLLQGLRALAGALHPECFRPVETVRSLQTDVEDREKSKIG